MEKQVHDTTIVRVLAAGDAGDQFGKLRPDTGKRGDGREQRIEYGGTHGAQNAMDFAHLAR